MSRVRLSAKCSRRSLAIAVGRSSAPFTPKVGGDDDDGERAGGRQHEDQGRVFNPGDRRNPQRHDQRQQTEFARRGPARRR